MALSLFYQFYLDCLFLMENILYLYFSQISLINLLILYNKIDLHQRMFSETLPAFLFIITYAAILGSCEQNLSWLTEEDKEILYNKTQDIASYRPLHFRLSHPSSYINWKPTRSAYFWYRMHQDQEKYIYEQLYESKLKQRYQIVQQKAQQKQICLINLWQRYNEIEIEQLLESLSSQSHRNYKILLQQNQQIQSLVESLEKSADKGLRKGSQNIIFFNKSQKVLQKCQKQSIVILILKNGYFSNKYSLSLYNSIYTNNNYKVVFSNQVIYDKIKHQPLQYLIIQRNNRLEIPELIQDLGIITFQHLSLQLTQDYSNTKQIKTKLFQYLQNLSANQIGYQSQITYCLNSNNQGILKSTYPQQILIQTQSMKEQLSIMASRLNTIHPLLKPFVSSKKITKLENSSQIAHQLNFAYKMYSQQILDKSHLQQFYYEQKLNISLNKKGIEQRNYCMISLYEKGINQTFSHQKILSLIGSIAKQHYENFQYILTYIEATDIQIQQLEFFVYMNYPHLINKISIISSQLKNRGYHIDNMIIKYCQQSSIIIPVSIESRLLGKLFFNVMNAVYSKQKIYNNKQLQFFIGNSFKRVKRGFFKYQNIIHTIADKTKKDKQLETLLVNIQYKLIAFTAISYTKNRNSILRYPSRIAENQFWKRILIKFNESATNNEFWSATSMLMIYNNGLQNK